MDRLKLYLYLIIIHSHNMVETNTIRELRGMNLTWSYEL